MIAPSAMFIESAMDQLKSPDTFAGHEWVTPTQHKELLCAVPTASNDFSMGYELGLQTARVLLSGMPAAVLNKVSF